jgi:hypothetical protein
LFASSFLGFLAAFANNISFFFLQIKYKNPLFAYISVSLLPVHQCCLFPQIYYYMPSLQHCQGGRWDPLMIPAQEMLDSKVTFVYYSSYGNQTNNIANRLQLLLFVFFFVSLSNFVVTQPSIVKKCSGIEHFWHYIFK